MNRILIKSSNLHSVAYLREEQILEVEFHNSGVYQFYKVPVRMFFELLEAESHGSYFNHHIKDHFRYRKIC